MRRQLVPGPVVRLTVIKAKLQPGIEASVSPDISVDSHVILYNENSWTALHFAIVGS